MSASVVVGQNNFTDDVTGATSTNFGDGTIRGIFVDAKGRLIVSDNPNNRVLIWNQVPTTNGKAADIVLGQPNFTSNTANNGGRSAQTLSAPYGVYSDGDRLFVLDRGNGRVLIWTSFPTQNQQAANVVVGQTDSTSSPITTCDAQHLSTSDPQGGVWVYGNKLIVSTGNAQRRILIWNTIPTANGTSANVVLGQSDMTTCTGVSTPTQTSLNSPRGISVDSRGRLVVADFSSANRVLIWNSIPTTNNTPADVVIGQSSFISNTSQTTANGLAGAFGVFSNGDRIFITDTNNHRVLIYNSIPSANGATADIVLGQTDFTSATSYAVSSSSLTSPQVVFEYQNKLFVSEAGGDRVLIFDNVIKKPNLSLNNSSEGVTNNQLRMNGKAIVDSPYIIKNVSFSVNTGDFSSATAKDGSYDSASEDYYFNFNPLLNQPKDSNGNVIDGYTVRVKSTNSNADSEEKLFYFSPFDLNSPDDNAVSLTSYPSFAFSVNRQRITMRDSLSKYQIQIKKLGSDTASWETLIDDIPVDFNSVKSDSANKQRTVWGILNTNNGVYETDKFYATYANESSKVKVYSKINALSGSYQWRAVAIDRAGHSQETAARKLFVNSVVTTPSNYFPLAILTITGIGDPHLNTYNLSNAKDSYVTSSSTPTFFGIAWKDSKVTLQLTKQDCTASCTKAYTAITNDDSRYRITVPKGDLQYGATYNANLSVMLGDRYNELPQFALHITGLNASNTNTVSKNGVTGDQNKKVTPRLSPTTKPISTPQKTQTSKKSCFFFICM